MHTISVLLVGMVLVMGIGCVRSQHPGTPMSSTCLEVPTVEECRATAGAITDERLWDCVWQQCECVSVNCSEAIREECRLKKMREGKAVMGFTFQPQFTTPFHPVREVNWCEEPVSRECRAKAMVHELAHACGWKHQMGGGVPGDDGELRCD